MRSFVRAAPLVAVALAMPFTARGEIPGPDRIEVLRTDDGPRVLLAGVGVGTANARAVARLGGAGVVATFFGGGPIMHRGALDGTACDLVVDAEKTGRVALVFVECTGSRTVVERLAGRFRAALASLPAHEDAHGVWFGDEERVAATLSVGPVRDDGWWDRRFGPQSVRFAIR